MALDIAAYRKIKAINGIYNGRGELVDRRTNKVIPWADYFIAYVNPDLPGGAGYVANEKEYSFSEAYGFRAGGYGGYNDWRDTLAKIAGYPALPLYPMEDASETSHCAACWNGAIGPFSELINFSDCEGVIGANVSKKLAGDFKEYQAKADDHKDEYFREKYSDWRTAFEMASDDGCVVFY